MTDNTSTEISAEWNEFLYTRDYEEGAIFNAPWYQDLKASLLQGGTLEEFLEAKDKKHYAAFLEFDSEIISIKESLKKRELEKQEALDKISSNNFKSPEEKKHIEDSVSYYQNSIDNLNKKLENKKNDFHLSSEENDCIRDFVTKNKDLLLTPPQMTDAEVKEFGLSQQYIEGEFLKSKYPEACYSSIRNYYEELSDPAAPRLAYNGRASKGRKGKEIAPENMVAKLREKGLDAVLDTDERAKDPHVFVVNHDSVFSPFLAPKEALKANIAIIEATRDLGGFPSLSNPLLRESMVKAAEPEHDGDLYDVKIDIYSKNKKHNPEQLTTYLQNTTAEWAETKTTYSNLSNIVNKLQTDNPQLHGVVVQSVSSAYNQLNSSGQWNLETAENLAKEILNTHGEQLNPYIFEIKQANMAKEAFGKGELPYELDRRAKEFMATNGYPESVFHAGKQGANPYAVLCSEKEGNMCMLYGAATVVSYAENNKKYNIHGNGCLGYAFGMSSHTKREIRAGNYRVGFLYEYESRKEKQEMLLLDVSQKYKGGNFDIKDVHGIDDETAILPHQNKLKKIYLALEGTPGNQKIFPLELDEKGMIKDKKWRDFVELYNPVNDNMSGNMVARQNNMIAEYDTLGKDSMYRQIENLGDTKVTPEHQIEQNIVDSPIPPVQDMANTSVTPSLPPMPENINTGATPSQMQSEPTIKMENELQTPPPVENISSQEVVQEVTQQSQTQETAKVVSLEGKYSEAAMQLIEQRTQLAYDAANPYGMPTEQQCEEIRLKKEFEMQMAKSVAKVMEEKGADLFASGDSQRIEQILKEQAIKDGLLVEKNSEMFGKSVEFSNGGVYLEHEGNLFGMAVNIAKQRMDTELSKLAPEQQNDAAQIKQNFHIAGTSAQQASYAISAADKLSAQQPSPQVENSQTDDKHIGKIIYQMRMGHNPLLEGTSQSNQNVQERSTTQQQLPNNAMLSMKEMSGPRR